MNKRKVCQIGNSLGIIIPVEVCDSSGLIKGKEISYEYNSAFRTITFYLDGIIQSPKAELPSYLNKDLARKIKDYILTNPKCRLESMKIFYMNPKMRLEFDAIKNFYLKVGHLVLSEYGECLWYDDPDQARKPFYKPLTPEQKEDVRINNLKAMEKINPPEPLDEAELEQIEEILDAQPEEEKNDK